MDESEGRAIAAIPKWGEPESEWRQDRPNTHSNSFGVVDNDGKTIRALDIELIVVVTPRMGFERYIFSLRKLEFGVTHRAYQLDINSRPVKRTDHVYSHEHFGDDKAGRYLAHESWAQSSFDEAVSRFCAQVNLTLTANLPNYKDFSLK